MDQNKNTTENTAQVAIPQFAFDIYLKIGDVKGDSTQDNRKDWLESPSWGK